MENVLINESRRPDAGVRVPRAFTLVEMLTVVVIVAILVGILVPTVNRARSKAKETVTRATIATLSTGLETFRADQRIGGAYPPSASDMTDANGRLLYSVTNPRETPLVGADPSVPTPLRILGNEVSGASLLVWALAGADLLGTPGFRPVSPATQWSASTSQTFNPASPASSGLYALFPANDARAGQPVHQRVAPFVDMGKIGVTRYDPNIRLRSGRTGSFVVEAEAKAVESMGLTGVTQRRFPFFLDGFGSPILYWRADPAGTAACDVSPNSATGNVQRGVYHFLDNGSLLANGANNLGISGGPGSLQDPLLLRAKANREKPHNLIWDMPRNAPLSSIALGQERGFARYIRNKNVTAKLEPQNAQGYLLVSPGEDGNFGTADDIANFEHNGGELTPPP